MTRHALIRSAVLVVLGMVLVSIHPGQWTWYFDDTLTQIGLAYPALFLTSFAKRRHWWLILGIILLGDWLWFALYPLPPPNFDYAAVGVPAEWLRLHGLAGFEAHWQMNSNASWAFDYWFLNQFPVRAVYAGQEHGLTTLNFVPSIGTMILGLLAGDVMRSSRPAAARLWWLAAFGILLLGAGWALDASGFAPSVKAVWTPSWVLFSGGWCCLILAVFYATVDLGGYGRPAFVLKVVGSNSLVAYTLSHIYPAFAFNSLRRIVGEAPFEILGQAYEPVLYGMAVLAMYWLFLYLLYERRIFIRI